jgi:short-subunit dehydrogenase
MPREFWKDRVVFVTGASSGIGEALAIRLGERGARLALFARRADLLRALAGRIEARGGRAIVLAGSVTQRGAVVDAVRRASDALGPVDVLIANAGIGAPTPGVALDPVLATEIVEVNLVGALNSVSACLPSMLARGRGHVVAIASLAAFRGFPGSAAYCASKAGMRALFESLRVDLAPRGIRVTTVCPGYVDTPMVAASRSRMPFLQAADPSALRILRAIERGRREVLFPWQTVLLTRVLAALPAGLYDWIGMRVVRALTRSAADGSPLFQGSEARGDHAPPP